MNNTAKNIAIELQAVRSEMAQIGDRMRAVPFETPVNYTEYANLRARRFALGQVQRSLLNEPNAPRSIHGIDAAIADAIAQEAA